MHGNKYYLGSRKKAILGLLIKSCDATVGQREKVQNRKKAGMSWHPEYRAIKENINSIIIKICKEKTYFNAVNARVNKSQNYKYYLYRTHRHFLPYTHLLSSTHMYTQPATDHLILTDTFI